MVLYYTELSLLFLIHLLLYCFCWLFLVLIQWNSNNSSNFLSAIFKNGQFILSHTLARNIHSKSFRKLFKDWYLLSEFIELNLKLICQFHNKNKDIPIKEVLFNTTINQRHFHDPLYSIIMSLGQKSNLKYKKRTKLVVWYSEFGFVRFFV